VVRRLAWIAFFVATLGVAVVAGSLRKHPTANQRRYCN
jgi:hypothetical protein